MVQKACAKVIGNYLKASHGYFENGLRILTGNPSFIYSLSGSISLATTFQLLKAADNANYIMVAATGFTSGTLYN
jgi:hypothetical protein